MSAQFPTNVYTPRETENLPGVVYDPDDKKNFFSEDFQNQGAEITSIEEYLLTTSLISDLVLTPYLSGVLSVKSNSLPTDNKAYGFKFHLPNKTKIDTLVFKSGSSVSQSMNLYFSIVTGDGQNVIVDAVYQPVSDSNFVYYVELGERNLLPGDYWIFWWSKTVAACDLQVYALSDLVDLSSPTVICPLTGLISQEYLGSFSPFTPNQDIEFIDNYLPFVRLVYRGI